MTARSHSFAAMALRHASLILFALMLAIFGAISPRFLGVANLANIAVQAAPAGIVAVGMTFVLLTGGVDLSVGAIMFVGAAIAGKLALAGQPLWLALTAMMAVAVLFGGVNAFFITRLRVAAFIVTLALLFVGRGFALWITQTRAMNLPDAFLEIGATRFAGVPLPLLIFMVVAGAAHLVLTRTPFGRQVHALGEHPENARKAGVPVAHILVAVYVISGVCAAAGGILLLGQLGSVSPKFGDSYEFKAIAAAVLGGTSLFGGRGAVLPGTVLGAVLIQSVDNGLVILNADPYLYPLITSAVIFLAVMLDSARNTVLARSLHRKIRPSMPIKSAHQAVRLLVVAACLAGLLLPSTTLAAAARPPNVVIVLTDDQGYGDLSCHGNPVLKTPQLDRLHAESIRFTDFHVAPMCTPTRGQLLTGRDGLANGAMNVSSGRTLLRRELPTMADMFAASGYQCGQFGKWHLGDNHPFRPHDRGFHEAIYYPSSHIGSAPDAWDNDYMDDVYLHKGRRRQFKGYTTDVFFREAMAWMRGEAAAQRPFFCYIATATAHAPLFVPEKYRTPYQDQAPALAAYYGMIANIDENMERLDAFLIENGLREDTIVIFMTDNGGTAGVAVFNSGMRGRKIDLWEGGHRVPCFLRWPNGRLRAPGDVAALTQVQDVLPTLVDLCSLRPPGAKFDGISLAPLLRGQTDTLPDRTLVVQFSRMQTPVPQRGDAAVLWRRWRLIRDQELYDLDTDLAQKNNVIAQHPEIAARLRAQYERWWEKVAPTVNDMGAVVLGSEAENPTQLSPAEWMDVFFDQGAQVRNGLRRNGAWNLLVERAGTYEIELRRWPREKDVAIAAGIPSQPHAFGEFRPGVALPIVHAKLKIGDVEKSQPVAPGDSAVIETVRLERGPTRMQTWFLDADGKEVCGAYYVYVTRK